MVRGSTRAGWTEMSAIKSGIGVKGIPRESSLLYKVITCICATLVLLHNQN